MPRGFQWGPPVLQEQPWRRPSSPAGGALTWEPGSESGSGRELSFVWALGLERSQRGLEGVAGVSFEGHGTSKSDLEFIGWMVLGIRREALGGSRKTYELGGLDIGVAKEGLGGNLCAPAICNFSPAPVLCHRLPQWGAYVWAEPRGAADLRQNRRHDRGVEKFP